MVNLMDETWEYVSGLIRTLDEDDRGYPGTEVTLEVYLPRYNQLLGITDYISDEEFGQLSNRLDVLVNKLDAIASSTMTDMRREYQYKKQAFSQKE